MGKSPLVLAVGIVAFAAGVAAGYFARRDPPATPPPPRTEPRAAAPPTIVVSASAPGESDVQFQRTVEVQKERIQELETRIVELERKGLGVKSKAEKLVGAKELFDMFIRLSKGKGDPDENLKAMSRLADLDADTASYFIDRYKEGTDKEAQEKSMALFLAMASGGAEVSALILQVLTDPSAPATDRQSVLQGLSGMGGFTSPNKLPVGNELAQVAYRLAGSKELAERQGGAGLLGGVDSHESRAALQQLAFNDADFTVRAAAFRSLGYVGDRATILFLEGYSLPPAPTTAPENAWQNWQHTAMVQALESAKERLRKRFP